jgi:RNA polymerase sigma-70 factor (ECF subfamily)
VNESDAELMFLYQNGDDAAFERLVARYEGRLASFFLRWLSLSNYTDANELEAETWMRVVRCKDRYDQSRGPLKAWIYGIARKLGNDELAARYHSFSLDRHHGEMFSRHGSVTEEPSTTNPESGILNTVDVQTALAKLSKEQREVLWLVDVEEFTIPEIARILWRNEEAVKSRVRRARTALSAALSLGNRGSARRTNER